MKKLHIIGAISFLALSLLFTGCGSSEKKEAPTEQQNTQSQQMENMDDHTQMNKDSNTSSQQSQDMNKMQETMSNSNSKQVQEPPKASSQNNSQKTPAVKVETISKPATVPQQESVNTVTTDMSTMDHSQMDHSQMDMDGQQSDNK